MVGMVEASNFEFGNPEPNCGSKGIWIAYWYQSKREFINSAKNLICHAES